MVRLLHSYVTVAPFICYGCPFIWFKGALAFFYSHHICIPKSGKVSPKVTWYFPKNVWWCGDFWENVDGYGMGFFLKSPVFMRGSGLFLHPSHVSPKARKYPQKWLFPPSLCCLAVHVILLLVKIIIHLSDTHNGHPWTFSSTNILTSHQGPLHNI